jgi:hypothetical protein
MKLCTYEALTHPLASTFDASSDRVAAGAAVLAAIAPMARIDLVVISDFLRCSALAVEPTSCAATNAAAVPEISSRCLEVSDDDAGERSPMLRAPALGVLQNRQKQTRCDGACERTRAL